MIIKLELGREYYIPIYAQQFNQGDEKKFQILNEDRVPFNLDGYSVRVKAIKPDSTKIYNDMIIDDNKNGLCTLKLTTQILALNGLVEMQLEIRKSGIIINTIIFSMLVRTSIDPTALVESTNEFTALSTMMDKVEVWDSYFQITSGKIEEKYTNRLNKAEADIVGFQSQLEDNAMQTISTDASLTKLNSVLDGNLIVDKIQGRTLVNLSEKQDEVKTVSVNYAQFFNICELSRLELDTDYTLIFTVKNTFDSSKGYHGYIGAGKIDSYAYDLTPGNGLSFISSNTGIIATKFKITQQELNKGGSHLAIRPSIPDSTPVTYPYEVSLSNVMVLKGDYTQKPPSYFKGIKAVGEDNQNKIKVITHGKNLFDGVWEVGDIAFDTGNNTTASNNCIRFKNYIKVIPGSTITMTKVSAENTKIRLYDSNKVYIGTAGFPGVSLLTYTYKLPETVFYVRFVQEEMSDLSTLFQIEYGDNATPYEPYKEDKSEISLTEPLRGVLNIYDYVTSKGNVNRNLKQILVNDSTCNFRLNTSTQNIDYLVVETKTTKVNASNNAILEGFAVSYATGDKISNINKYWVNTNNIVVGITKGTSLEQAKALVLNKNLVYQIATIIEPLNSSLILTAFKDGYFGINAGAINPVVNLRYTTNQGERVTALEEVVKNLTDRYYDLLKTTIKLVDADVRKYDLQHPVGSIYITFNKEDDPNKNFIGTTWIRTAKGQTLIGVNEDDIDFNTANKTGGEKTHTLTELELAVHSHISNVSSRNSGSVDTWNTNTISTGVEQKTGQAGGGQPHNNLQPYITVYFWTRTA